METEHFLVKYCKERNLTLPPVTEVMNLPAEAVKLVNDLQRYPHAFVLACCMSTRVKASKAWLIPYRVKEILCPKFSIDALAQIPEHEYQRAFSENKLHIDNIRMASRFLLAVERIRDTYDGDASRIWSGMPSSAEAVYRFLQFEGVGVKIATMATNILHRQFRVPFSDLLSIDISPDAHVRRVFKRYGFVSDEDSRESVMYKARALCPQYPGIFDEACWIIGRQFCHPQAPDCINCPINRDCAKRI